MTINCKLNRALLAALLAVAGAQCAMAQQPAAKSSPDKKSPEKKAPGQALLEKQQFDAYIPSKWLRNSYQACMKDEVTVGAYCAKKCQAGYQMESKGNFATCRSLTPLPPGVMPGPRREQTGIQPELPKPIKPLPRMPSE
jgi:hypothetical protein